MRTRSSRIRTRSSRVDREDGTVLVSGSNDKTVRLWRVA
jgi:WD40 repeat protein